MMPLTSKSSNRKKLKFKLVLNPRQQWQVKQHDDDVDRDWLELPSDVMANILYRVGVYDILENAQKVCAAWRNICKDPAMWRVLYMDNDTIRSRSRSQSHLMMQEMCKHAVDRSQGQLVDITICEFANVKLIQYIADRSSQLKRLELAFCHENVYDDWAESLKKLPLLEELNLYETRISHRLVRMVGRYCPMLTTLRMNLEMLMRHSDLMAMAIAKSLPKLKHLEVIRTSMSKPGLQAILDGCPHLELLDLRQCCFIHKDDPFRKKLLEKIKCVRLPDESIEGCPYLDEDDPIIGPVVCR